MNIVFTGSSRSGLRRLQNCLDQPFIKTAGVVTASQTLAVSFRPDGVVNMLHAKIGQLFACFNHPQALYLLGVSWASLGPKLFGPTEPLLES
jgi:hypothetical protein